MTRWCITVLVVCLLCVSAADSRRVSAAGQIRDDGPKVATAGQLIISEFRLKGNGATATAQDNNEFIEIYNASGASHTVAALSGAGYGIAASDGVTRCVIPNGTVIPNRGHFLCVNSVGYNLAAYPAGNGTFATGDATYTTEIPQNTGIAIFNNSTGGGSYSLANRLDAVGSASEANTTYKEGTGYPNINPAHPVDHSVERRTVGMCVDSDCTGGSRTTPLSSGAMIDTNNNATDFYFNDTNGTNSGFGQRLGTPGPQNLSSPIMLDSSSSSLIVQKASGCSPRDAAPNRVRDFTAGPDLTSSQGTLDLRSTWKNVSGGNITRLRFRIIDLTTFPATAGVADLRPISSPSTSMTADTYPCGTGTFSLGVEGTSLETPPSQPNGSGFNGSLSVGSISLGTPLANNASVTIRFMLGVETVGIARFCVIPETLPAVAGDPYCYIGSTESTVTAAPGDFDYDQKAEMAMYNQATGVWRILKSSSGFTSETLISWGGPGYRSVPGDYDADGRDDVAVYNMATGVWSILTSSSNFTHALSVTLGGPGSLPQPGDYDGDGATDISVSNSAAGTWMFRASSTNFSTLRTTFWAAPPYTSVPGQDFDGDGHDDLVAYLESSGQWVVLTSSSDFSSSIVQTWGGRGYTLVPGDYDGDGRSDYGIYNRMTGVWSILTSSSGYTSSIVKSWGGPGFLPVPADFDGDRKLEIAYYRPSTNNWLALKSTTSYATVLSATYGTAADIPLATPVVPVSLRENKAGDADGDHISDLTVYNTTSGVWSTLTSSSNFTSATNRGWGGTGYAPAPGDYDGDGLIDLGLYVQSTGQWLVLRSGAAFTTTYSFNAGGPGYIPVAGDYDGDGRADMITYNTTTGLWYGLKSSGGFATTFSKSWGGTGYTAVPGDYDADGKLDLGLYQASTGNWLILNSSTNYTTVTTRGFGGSGYAPVAADFDGDGITDFAVYQTATGIWTMLKSSTGNTIGFTVSYGGPAYTPVAGDWDGDGRADVAVYDTAGNWSILLSSSNFTASLGKSWGGAGYTALPQFP